ncbi:MAG: hypothetical protein RIB46_16105 [Pseudomonadales bacterium]
MNNNSERSLKSLNMKWLVLLAVADVLAVLFFVAPELLSGASLTEVGIGRVLTTTVMPVVVLLLVNVVPHDIKSMLVYWKARGWLPGREAFTKYGPNDPRIDMAELQSKVGPLPTAPSDQNSKWYKLYKQVSTETDVSEAHKLFLMYRDMASMSVSLVVLIPLSLYFAGTAPAALWLAAALFAAQYVLTALSARWSGIRFVCNVLAVHSARDNDVERSST